MHAASGPEPTAVVVAKDAELRVFLRGLLRLHHVRVEGEAPGAGEGLELVRTFRPSLVFADAHLADGDPAALIAACHAAVPGLRAVLVAPASRAPSPAQDGTGPDAVLHRPFRIRQFVEALGLEGPAGPVA